MAIGKQLDMSVMYSLKNSVIAACLFALQGDGEHFSFSVQDRAESLLFTFSKTEQETGGVIHHTPTFERTATLVLHPAPLHRQWQTGFAFLASCPHLSGTTRNCTCILTDVVCKTSSKLSATQTLIGLPQISPSLFVFPQVPDMTQHC